MVGIKIDNAPEGGARANEIPPRCAGGKESVLRLATVLFSANPVVYRSGGQAQ
jgi:hypothetical protein